MREREPMTASDAERKQAFAALFRTGEAFKDVPTDELEQEVTKAVSEVRAENRQRDTGAAPFQRMHTSGGPA